MYDVLTKFIEICNHKQEQAKVEELVTLAVNSLITENQGDRSNITPNDIAEEVNKMERRTDTGN